LRLSEVGPFSAAISWKTDKPTAITIRFGEGKLFDHEVLEPHSTMEHHIALTGLKPSTIYFYRIEPAGITATFRSTPGQDGAFDILVLDGTSRACKEPESSFASLPDVIVLAGPCEGSIARKKQSVLTVSIPQSGVRILQYGNSQILLARDLQTAEEQPIEEADKNLRTIIIVPSAPQVVPMHADHVVLWPLGARRGTQNFVWDASKTAWFEIDAFEIARVDGDAQNRERTVIVDAPPETKKTCLYCNRLLESGRYEQSIGWYRDFIAENKDRHAMEDAYFSIAQILDEKLFRFNAALQEYEEFLRHYPSSRRASLVKYRVDYLHNHSDGDFEPLRQFEIAKSEFAKNNPGPSVKRVEHLVKEYPNAVISDEALFWLGHTFEPTDSEQAVLRYRELIARFPHGEYAALAAIAIGDIFYKDKLYKSAIEAYTSASQIVPDTYRISVADKLRKSRRNVTREIVRWLAGAVLSLWLALTIFWHPRPARRDLLALMAVSLAYIAVGGAYFTIAYEKAGDLIVPMSVLGASMCVVFLWNRILSRKKGQRAWIVAAHALTCSLAAAYLVLYSFHYLYVFGV